MTIHKMHIPIGHPNNPGIIRENLLSINFHYTNNLNPHMTDTANASWFGRAYSVIDNKFYEVNRNGKTLLDKQGNPVPFRFGCTQIIADMDSVTELMPTRYVTWSVGDRPLAFDNGSKGQKPLARDLFNYRQNYRSVNIEICNNDAIVNSDVDWWMACQNASRWTVDYLLAIGFKINLDKSLRPESIQSPKDLQENELVLLRHYDISGKICPAPFVGQGQLDWENFVIDIARHVKDKRTYL